MTSNRSIVFLVSSMMVKCQTKDPSSAESDVLTLAVEVRQVLFRVNHVLNNSSHNVARGVNRKWCCGFMFSMYLKRKACGTETFRTC